MCYRIHVVVSCVAELCCGLCPLVETTLKVIIIRSCSFIHHILFTVLLCLTCSCCSDVPASSEIPLELSSVCQPVRRFMCITHCIFYFSFCFPILTLTLTLPDPLSGSMMFLFKLPSGLALPSGVILLLYCFDLPYALLTLSLLTFYPAGVRVRL